MVIRLGSILFDYVAGRGLRCAVHSALCLGPHGLYDVLKVITPRTRPEYPTQRARYPQVCQILTPREQSSWSPSPFHGLFAHRLACQRAMAMPPDTTAVTVGSAHCGGKWEGCANMSPINVAIALIVACRAALSIVRSICARRATATAALTMPQTEARNACSKLNAARTFPRAITRKQASQAPPNFSAAGRTNQPARKSSNASRTLNLRLRIDRPFPLGRFFHRDLVVRHATEKG